MLHDHEKFKNILAGIQSLVISVAVVIGGVWTLITFNVLDQVAKARAELEVLQSRHSAIEIDIEASQVSLSDDQRKQCILASVVIKNTGTQNAVLEFQRDGPMAVTPVTFDKNGAPVYGETVRASIAGSNPRKTITTGTFVRAGSRSHYRILVPVQKPGVYFLTFSADATGSEAELSKKAAGARRQTWGAQLYFVVK